MRIEEQIMLWFSRPPGADDALNKRDSVESALSLLEREYPDFRKIVAGKRVADFGCGRGYQSIALATLYDCNVVGIESNSQTLESAMERAAYFAVPQSRLHFTDRTSAEMKNSFDIVISQNSFEHFRKPDIALREMRDLLNGSGKILITFGPPWLAPYGSHMHFFCNVPWLNILFSEQAVMNVRSRYANDGAKKYEDVASGLNKMTIAKLERLVSASGLKMEFRNYNCIKGMNWISKIPLVREFFINHVTLTLTAA